MNTCNILGHDETYDAVDFIDTDGYAPVFNHCRRCHKVTGIFAKLADRWAYFKR